MAQLKSGSTVDGKAIPTSLSDLSVTATEDELNYCDGVTSNIQDQLDEIWEMVYPIGAIYMSVVSTSPATLFGGTWKAWGTGRVPVGIDGDDGYFDTKEKTGGSKTAHSGLSMRYNRIMSVNSFSIPNFPQTTYAPVTRTDESDEVTGSGGYTVNPSDDWKYEGANLQPYITCYMWKRTA
jgi:hypothetical protein